MAIDYQGRGHYGKTKTDISNTHRRDMAKRAICEKANVTIIQLDAEYAFSEKHQKLFQHFLIVFRDKRYDHILVSSLLREQITAKGSSSTLTDQRLVNLLHRLDIYEIQRKGESIYGLLWELHQIKAPISPLPLILSKLDT